MSSGPAHPLSAIGSSETVPQVLGSLHRDAASPAGTDRTDLEPGWVETSRTKSWWLKLAVLLVVAALCIAFAGLVWALIF
jgi:hypothetical protein